MQNFNYHNPAKIIFGKDSEKEIQALLHDLNVHSLLLVYRRQCYRYSKSCGRRHPI